MNKSFKKGLALLLCSFLLLGATGCQQQDNNSSNGTTYTASAAGYHGDVKVEVVVADNKIEAVNVVEHGETEGVGTNAIDKLPGQIVEQQSLNLDVVAGATMTSNAILEAVEKAATEAGLDIEALKASGATEEKELEEVELSTDVVVVGAGASGLTATLKLSDAGHDVILLEKMSFTGGSTAAAGGGMYIIGTEEQKANNTQSDPEPFKEHVMAYGHNFADEKMLDIYANYGGPAVDYLMKEQGAEIKWDGAEDNQVYGHFSNVNRGAGLAKKLTENVETKENVDLMLSTRATELIVEDGKVTGIKAESDSTAYTLKAQAVILATGGYSCNEELVSQHVPAEAINYGVNYLTGDGLLMAQEIGAASTNLDKIAIKPWGIETTPKGGTYFMNQKTVTSTTGSIIVNNKGVRVMNEEAEESINKETYLEQEDHCLYLFMNQNGYDTFASGNFTFDAEQVAEWLDNEEGYPLLVSGASVEEVAEKAGIDAAALAQTVADYDVMVEGGVDTQFGHTISEKIGEGPYYILKMSIRYCQTLGGLVANENLQVVNTEGNAIEGLYAAGEVVGDALGDEAFSLLSWAVASGYYVADAVDAVIE